MNFDSLLGNEKRHLANHVAKCSEIDTSPEKIKKVIINQVMNFADYIERCVPGTHPIIRLNQIFTRHVLVSAHKMDPDLYQVLNDFGINKHIDVLEMVHDTEKYYKKQRHSLSQEDLLNLIISFLQNYDEIMDAKEDDFKSRLSIAEEIIPTLSEASL